MLVLLIIVGKFRIFSNQCKKMGEQKTKRNSAIKFYTLAVYILVYNLPNIRSQMNLQWLMY